MLARYLGIVFPLARPFLSYLLPSHSSPHSHLGLATPPVNRRDTTTKALLHWEVLVDGEAAEPI